MQRLVLGDVEIVRLVEYQGPFGPAGAIVPDLAERVWRAEGAGLAPDHYEAASGSFVGALQTFVLRSGGRTVLVDTGVGDGRERPGTPLFHRREGGRFMALLARAGVRPEDVDVVVNTHLHADHVGWNTRERDGAWVPAFPNADYYLPAADLAFFDPAAAHPARAAGGPGPELWEDWDRVFADSVAPVLAAGQAVPWSGQVRLDGALVLAEAPGHTPGSSVLRLDSGGERAVFVGDLLHSPVQLAHPSCSSCFCLDPVLAARSRQQVLARAADEKALVVPAHFAGAGAARVRGEGAGFAADWADWTPVE
ncbi:MBL fold metallo-hydrolase [Streptomyces rubellomurinus]|uniref:Beta-lactamase n=2 Tax=Streptomyces TaxID=1883 RepID=A0A0F2T8U3_STRR3|nr:MBL fold metallo-hydrolase [Streptomyces rubellomurinus]KJS59649.1 beta-lactamase [Streptomyces rubellomurinus]